MSDQRQLLSELLRPQQLSDLTLPKRDIDRLQRMVASGRMMNMIFYGRPGLGKTSAARTMLGLIDAEQIEINPSSIMRNGGDLRGGIEGFATTVAMTDYKICLIDEADFIPLKMQASLRHLIESTSKHCRFLFTVNKITKITDALRSRMKQVCFDIAPAERAMVIERLKARYEEKLHELGIQFNPKRLGELIGIYYPDLRSIANQVEYEFG